MKFAVKKEVESTRCGMILEILSIRRRMIFARDSTFFRFLLLQFPMLDLFRMHGEKTSLAEK
jgi:hypothetical protein